MAEVNDAQTKLWNGAAGQSWVQAQRFIDRIYAPIQDVLVSAARAGDRVLDIGCGTGGVTVATARAAGGHCVGVDISDVMVDAARERAENAGVSATFLRADAQSYDFEAAAFDLVVSRFGVMFFEDFGAAFTNLRRATASGGGLRFVTWRGIEENPFMTTAETAAAPLMPDLPVRDLDGPGQFGLADPDRVRGLLDGAGWTEIDLQPLDVRCVLSEQELMDFITLLGPVGRALPDVDEDTRAKVIEVARAAFDPFVSEGEVTFTAACWDIAARA